MEIAFASEAGAQPVNEDACRAWAELGVFAVCDGLAVKSGGERASGIALEALDKWAKGAVPAIEKARATSQKTERMVVQQSLHDTFQKISQTIFQGAMSDPKYQGMCTTIDVLVLLGSHAVVAHTGSGRVYLVRSERVHQLTEDHTQLAHLRRANKLEGVSAATQASYSKRLMHAVGFREEVQVDIIAVELQPGDRFLLVTDGVWSPLGDEAVSRVAIDGGDAGNLLKTLHGQVAASKGRDNYSTVIVDPPRPPESGAEQKIKMLGTVPAFAYLSYQELIRVINFGELVKLGAGKEIWKEGDPGGEMMLILAGSLKVLKNGKQINVLKRGDVVGEMSMIDAAPRSASAVTMEATNLLAFPRKSLFDLFREDPQLAVKFLWGVTMEMNKRLRSASSQLAGGSEMTSATPLNAGPLPFLRGDA